MQCRVLLCASYTITTVVAEVDSSFLARLMVPDLRPSEMSVGGAHFSIQEDFGHTDDHEAQV